MNIWIAASIPFWIIGAAFFTGGCVWMADGIRGVESKKESGKHFLIGMLVSGVLFLIAAKIAS